MGQNESKFLVVLKTVMWAEQLDSVGLAKRLDICQNIVDDWLNGKELPNYYGIQKLKNGLNVCIEHYFE
jgi:hypothetical protein